MTAVVSWFLLPVMYSEWILGHSPWLEPIVRAQASHDYLLASYYGRLREWDEQAFPTLERLLRSRDPQVRQSALLGIRYIKVEARVPLPTSLATELARLALSDAQEDVRYWAVSALKDVELRVAVQAMIAATSDPSMSVRIEAFKSLRGSDDPAAIHCKEAALNDSDKDIRLVAVVGLGKQGDDDQVAVLSRVAAEDRESEVRLAAIDALEKSATPSAFKVLCEIIAKGQRVEEVDQAISTLTGSYRNYEKQAEEPLLTALGRPEPMVRAAVARHLGVIEFADPSRVHALLVAHLDDPEPWVRGWFAFRLARSFGRPADLEEIIIRYEDGRLPAPEMETPVTGNLVFNSLSAERQFEFMSELNLTGEQQARLERVKQRLRSEGCRN